VLTNRNSRRCWWNLTARLCHPPGPDSLTRVKQLIAEAEARGDARTASILADSLVKADAAELANEKRKQEAIEATTKYWANQKATADAEANRWKEERIKARTQELLYAHGDRHDYTEAKAREQATREVVGRPSFQDLGETG
jgi:chromatin segregation and condensation protein Rec8/ScpA/Scc1 (kleisin family)